MDVEFIFAAYFGSGEHENSNNKTNNYQANILRPENKTNQRSGGTDRTVPK